MSDASKDLPEWTAHPFLIYGPRKAGTTLLLNLLDGSDYFFVYPGEIKLKKALAAGGSPVTGVEVAGLLAGGLERCEEGMNMQGYQGALEQLNRASMTNLRDVLRFVGFSLCENLNSRPSQVNTWGFKEVGSRAESVIGLFRSHFFDGKVVMIVRSPFFVTRSVLRDRRRRGVKLGLGKKVKEIAAPVSILHAQLRLLGDERIYATSYEVLTGGRTEEEMRGICSFLGVPYSDIHKQPTVLGKPSVVVTSSKETQEVFAEEKEWTDGLTWSEVLLIRLVHAALKVYYRLTGRRYMPYQEALEQLEIARAGR